MTDFDPRPKPDDAAHTDAASYAINALSSDERAAFEHHLAGCTRCQREVDELQSHAQLLSTGLRRTPPADVRARLLALTSEEPAVESPDAEVERPESSTARGLPWRWKVAAAAAVLAAALIIWRPWSDDSSPAPQASVHDVMTADDATAYTSTLGDDISVIRSPDMGMAVIEMNGMTPPEGYRYQAWLMIDGEAVSAGMMPPPTDGTSQMMLDGDTMAATAVAVSLEPDGGSSDMDGDVIATVEL